MRKNFWGGNLSLRNMEYYQNIDGSSKEVPRRKYSRFWNEGKFKYFIRPLLPRKPQGMTLVDIGCNCGLQRTYFNQR